MEQKPTVVVIDDDARTRHSIERLLTEVQIDSRSCASADAFLETYDPDQPGCLIVDVNLPGMSGTELHKHLVAKGHAIPVIILTGNADVPMAVDALKLGAFDFVEKPVRALTLLDLVRRAIAQDQVDRGRAAEKQKVLQRYCKLTEREIEVIEFIIQGLNNKAIAAKLGVSSQAIDARRGRAMEKLVVASVPELVQVAVKAREWS